MIPAFISSVDHRAPVTKAAYPSCRNRAKQFDILAPNSAEKLTEIACHSDGLVLKQAVDDNYVTAISMAMALKDDDNFCNGDGFLSRVDITIYRFVIPSKLMGGEDLHASK